MIDSNKLILVACFVTALGLNIKWVEGERVRSRAQFTDGFSCIEICVNHPLVEGRTAKCFITYKGKVHKVFVRNPERHIWRFYAVDDFHADENDLCSNAVAGDSFLATQKNATCPHAKNHTTVGQRKGAATVSLTYDDNLKTAIDELNGIVRRMHRSDAAGINQFDPINKKLNDAVRRTEELMIHLKRELQRLDHGDSANYRGYASSRHKKKRSPYVFPPTMPPYFPTGSDEQNDDSLDDNSGLYNIAPPTFPPINPPGYRSQYDDDMSHEPHDCPNYHRPINKRGQHKNSVFSDLSPTKRRHPSLFSLRKRNDDNQYTRSDSDQPEDMAGDLYEEVDQMDDIQKRSVGQYQSSVRRNPLTNDETNEIRATYNPIDFNNPKALCSLMSLSVCEESRILYCKKDKACCWAHFDYSNCTDNAFGKYGNCYGGLYNILDTLTNY